MSMMPILYMCDQSKIRVLAGDIADGFWELEGSSLRALSGSGKSESVDLSGNIRELDLKDTVKKEPLEPLVTGVIGFFVGSRIFGLMGGAIGAATCYLLTPTRPEVTVRCELKDGRKFIATMSSPMYTRLRGLAPNN